jgi:hypothetical protein
MTITTIVSNELLIEAVKLRCKYTYAGMYILRKVTGTYAGSPDDAWTVIEQHTASEMFCALEEAGIDPATIILEVAPDQDAPLTETLIYRTWQERYRSEK